MALAACGGGGSSSNSTGTEATTTGSSGNSQVAAATKFVEKGLEAPEFQSLTPLKKKPPTGKSVLWLDCGLPVCDQIGEGVKEGSEALGWKFHKLTMGSVPEEISNAWTQAVRLSPEAVTASGVTDSLFESQLSQFAAKGVPYVANGVLEPVGKGITAVVSGPQNYVNRGSWMANWIVHDTEGKGNVLYVTDSEFPIVDPLLKSFEKEFASLCSSCSMSVFDAPTSEIGTTLPARIVSEVQRNPEINYIAMPFGDLATGVAQALSAAGLNEQVKLVDANPTATNYGAIKEGTEAAAIAESNIISGWTMVDALARFFNGEELPQKLYDVRPLQILTSENGLKDPNEPYLGIEGFEEKFKQLWHVG
jgi:ribose transport system substrate-binding protein